MKDELKKAKLALKKGKLEEAIDILKSLDHNPQVVTCPGCGAEAYAIQKSKGSIARCEECGSIWGKRKIEEIPRDEMIKSYQGAEMATKDLILKCLWDLYTTGEAEPWDINQFDQTGGLKKSLALKLQERFNIPLPKGFSEELRKYLDDYAPQEITWGGLTKSEILDTMLGMLHNNEEKQILSSMHITKFEQVEDVSPELLKAIMKKKGLDASKLSKHQLEDQDSGVTPDMISNNPSNGGEGLDGPKMKDDPQGGLKKSKDSKKKDKVLAKPQIGMGVGGAEVSLAASETAKKNIGSAFDMSFSDKKVKKYGPSGVELTMNVKKAKIREQRTIPDIYRQRGLSYSEKEATKKKPVKTTQHHGRKVKKATEPLMKPKSKMKDLGWSPKRVRQYEHIKESMGGDKQKAAMTVNAQRSAAGETKKAIHPGDTGPLQPIVLKPNKVKKAKQDIPKLAFPRTKEGAPTGPPKQTIANEAKMVVHAVKQKAKKLLGKTGTQVVTSLNPGGVGSQKKNGKLIEKQTLPNTPDLKPSKAPTPPPGSDKVKEFKVLKSEYINDLFNKLDTLAKTRDPELQFKRRDIALEITKIELMSKSEWEAFLEKKN